MMRTLGAGLLLGLAVLLPAQQASAQDPVGGAIVGGALGGIIGGALGRGKVTSRCVALTEIQTGAGTRTVGSHFRPRMSYDFG